MRSSRHAHRTAAAALLVLGALLLLGLSIAGPAAAAPAAVPAAASSSVVKFQSDYTLPQGQTVDSVVVIRGDAVIGGTVTRSVVVIAGNATIESTAVVGAGQPGQSSSVVVVDGHLTVEPGAVVHGKTTQVAGLHAGGLARAAAAGVVLRPIGVVAGWWQLLFLPIVALVVSALFPRTTERVGRRVRAGFWPSMGWGLLGFVVSILLLVVLAVTIVGLLVAVPGAFALIAGLLFCAACVAAALGRLVLSGSERYRDNLIAAAVVGAVLMSLVSLVPAVGGIVLFLATMAGFGAALTLLNEWRTARHAGAAPAGGPAGPGAPPSGPGPARTDAPASTPGWPSPPPQGWSPQAPPQGWSAQAPPQGWSAQAPPQGWSAQAPPQGWGTPPGWSAAPPRTGPPQSWAPPSAAPAGWTPAPPPWWPAPPAGASAQAEPPAGPSTQAEPPAGASTQAEAAADASSDATSDDAAGTEQPPAEGPSAGQG